MLLLRKREAEEEEGEQRADAVGDTGVPDTPIATDIPANEFIQLQNILFCRHTSHHFFSTAGDRWKQIW
jgi:hypothetical protein